MREASATRSLPVQDRFPELLPEPALRDAALRDAATYLTRLAEDPLFLETRVAPLLQEARGASDWYVAHRYDAPNGAFSLQVFVWPPGSRTQIHDHSSWGAYRCLAGSLLEERYERLDDGSVAEHARLRELWKLLWTPQDGVSTVLAGDGGIHRVGNARREGEEVALSVHLYGPRPGGALDGRDYDPSRDYVCDRLAD